MTATAQSYQILPALSEDDLNRLRESIKAYGVLVPVEVDEDGNVLDGYHRDLIARELGVECPTVVRSGMDHHEKRIFAATVNLARRHLTDGQKVMVGRAIEADIAELARANQAAGLKRGASAGSPLAANAAIGKTSDKVAETVGLGSGDTYERGKRTMEQLERESPTKARAVERGEMTLAQARQELRDGHDAEYDGADVGKYDADHGERLRVIRALVVLNYHLPSGKTRTRGGKVYDKEDVPVERMFRINVSSEALEGEAGALLLAKTVGQKLFHHLKQPGWPEPAKP